MTACHSSCESEWAWAPADAPSPLLGPAKPELEVLLSHLQVVLPQSCVTALRNCEVVQGVQGEEGGEVGLRNVQHTGNTLLSGRGSSQPTAGALQQLHRITAAQACQSSS